MAFEVTSDQLSQFVPTLAPADAQSLATAINAMTAQYGIDQSPRRVRYFLAQSAFESSNFSAWSENLNYTTPERLVAVWPSRFTCNANACTSTLFYAPNYINNPQALANLVYASRSGNGDVASGDGYRFRGRGAFGLTFRTNYTQYSQSVYGDDRIVINPDQVAAQPDAMMSAGWFWSIKGLNAHADADEFTITTTIINGSAATVPQRLPVLNRANAVFTWS